LFVFCLSFFFFFSFQDVGTFPSINTTWTLVATINTASPEAANPNAGLQSEQLLFCLLMLTSFTCKQTSTPPRSVVDMPTYTIGDIATPISRILESNTTSKFSSLLLGEVVENADDDDDKDDTVTEAAVAEVAVIITPLTGGRRRRTPISKIQNETSSPQLDKNQLTAPNEVRTTPAVQ
jgi:hypothetical protein